MTYRSADDYTRPGSATTWFSELPRVLPDRAAENATCRRSEHEWRVFAAWHFLRIEPSATPTMLRLKPRRRTVLVETLRELANLVAGALVLAQFVGQQPMSLGLFLAGVAAWFTLVGLAMLFAGDER